MHAVPHCYLKAALSVTGGSGGTSCEVFAAIAGALGVLSRISAANEVQSADLASQPGLEPMLVVRAAILLSPSALFL